MSESVAQLCARLRDYADTGHKVSLGTTGTINVEPFMLTREDAAALLAVVERGDAYRAWLDEQNPDDAVKVRHIIDHFDRVVPRAARAGAGDGDGGRT